MFYEKKKLKIFLKAKLKACIKLKFLDIHCSVEKYTSINWLSSRGMWWSLKCVKWDKIDYRCEFPV